MFSEKRILVGVCGGIAAYKVCELVRELRRQHADVRVMMTKGAVEFIAPLTFQALSGHEVSCDLYKDFRADIEHIELANWADAIMIAPATATTMAKLAHGIADNVLTSTVLATHAPVVVAPSMNTGMWENAATVENTEILHRRHFRIVDPEYGALASQIEGAGMGRLAPTARLLGALLAALQADRPLDGVQVVVTAGRTEEFLDPVRILTNRSTGRMGYALAEMAAAFGARVHLISGPSTLAPPEGVRLSRVVSAEQMYEMVDRNYPEGGLLLMAAAVADFRPKTISPQKIKKINARRTIELVANPDILAAMGKRKKKAVHVGFALETENEVQNAQKKLQRKNLDMIVLNNPSHEGAGFGVSTNKVKIIMADGREEELPLMQKTLVAREVLLRAARIGSDKKIW